jgi:SAM-dependent methyltransferase
LDVSTVKPTPPLQISTPTNPSTPPRISYDRTVSTPPTPPIFYKEHSLLSRGDEPTRDHTEADGNERVYTKISPYSVLLNASPQIGKTGAFLSVLEILYDNHIIKIPEQNLPVDPPVETRQDNNVEDLNFGALHMNADPRQYGNFTQVNAYLRHLASLENDELENTMNGGYFDWYHQRLFENRELINYNANTSILQNLQTIALSSPRDHWNIVDCGCGMHGFAPAVNDRPKSFKKSSCVTVTGIDFNRNIENCLQNSAPNPKLVFKPVVNHILRVPVDERSDVVIFNASLFCEEITPYLEWAYNRLNDGGYLWIVDLQRRFPDNYGVLMQQMGWQYPDDFEEGYNIISHDPYAETIWQKTPGSSFTQVDIRMKRDNL